MTAFNVVRFRVKPGQAENFIEAHRSTKGPFEGWQGGWLVRTGEETFCLVGQWKSFDNIVNARPQMIGFLDQMRDMLEELGGGLGVTDPVSGDAVLQIGGPPRKRAGAGRKAKPARKRGVSAKKATPAKKRAGNAGKAKTRPAPARKRKTATKKRGR